MLRAVQLTIDEIDRQFKVSWPGPIDQLKPLTPAERHDLAFCKMLDASKALAAGDVEGHKKLVIEAMVASACGLEALLRSETEVVDG